MSLARFRIEFAHANNIS